MLQHHLTVKEVAEHMGCSATTARIRMRQMVHTESPLTVTENELNRWWNERTFAPVSKIKHSDRTYCHHMTKPDGKFLIPRKRPSLKDKN